MVAWVSRCCVTVTRATCLADGDDALDLGGVGVRIGMRAGPVEREIAGRFRPQLRRAGRLRRGDGDHRIERLVVDLDQVGGVLRRERGLRDHHRDRLADIHHALARQRVPVRHHELAAAAARQRRMARHAADAGGVDVGGGHDRDHAAHLLRCIHVDAADAGVGVRRAHEGRRGLTGLGGIGDEAAVAAHEVVVLDARMMGVAVGGLGVHAGCPGGVSRAAVIAQIGGAGEGFRRGPQSATNRPIRTRTKKRDEAHHGSGQYVVAGAGRRPSPR